MAKTAVLDLLDSSKLIIQILREILKNVEGLKLQFLPFLGLDILLIILKNLEGLKLQFLPFLEL